MRNLYLTFCALLLSFASYAIGPITGNLNVCVGATTTLADTAAGGTWSSSMTSVATVGATTGIVSGISAGTATISYITATDTVTADVTVHAAPAACPQPIGCVGVADTLIGCAAPGYWSAPVAMVDTATGKGYLTAATAGTVTVTYTVDLSGCVTTTVVTINPTASAGTITGTATICISSITTLASSVSGGTWSSGSPSVVAIGASDGIATGLSAGTSIITYTVNSACGLAIATRTVNVVTTASAGTISGGTGVCMGSTTTLASTVPGGTWSSSSAATATVDVATGVVSGIFMGTATISYTVVLSCGTATSTTMINVNAWAAPIHSSTLPDAHQICIGGYDDLITTGAGTWSSSDPAVAAITGSGIVFGLASGTTTITYTLTSGCFSTYSLTVNAPPAPITGTMNICYGTTSALAALPAGGTWISSNMAIASVGYTSGVVSPSASTTGTSTITYTLGRCSITAVVTVYPYVTPITGSATVCTGQMQSLAQATTGGTWSSSNTTAVTIDTMTGVMTGVTAGTATIMYTLPGTGCVPVKVITVNPSPAAITGDSLICLGSTVTLNDTTTGGTWSTSSVTIVAVGSATGIVTGAAGGTATISYTLANGCSSVATVTVAPYAISGLPSVSAGLTITLSNAMAGGAWGSSNTAVATVGATSGIVTGVATGTSIITYQVAGGCYATKQITVTHGLSVQQAGSGNEVSVYPNPATGNVFIKWNNSAAGTAAVVITDVVGREVYRSEVVMNAATPAKLAVDHLQQGVYFISVRTENSNYSGKIVLEN